MAALTQLHTIQLRVEFPQVRSTFVIEAIPIPNILAPPEQILLSALNYLNITDVKTQQMFIAREIIYLPIGGIAIGATFSGTLIPQSVSRVFLLTGKQCSTDLLTKKLSQLNVS